MQNLLNPLLSKKSSFLAILFFITLSSCQKDVELEDSTLNPGDELIISGTDEFSFFTSTVEEMPLEGIRQNIVPLGKINDQRFGEMQASFYTNFRLTITGFDPTGPVSLDSAFFFFKYNGTYGPLSESFSVEVFELDQAINTTDSLNNAETLNIKPNVIASASNLTFQAGQEGVLKIPIQQNFAQGFVDRFGTQTFENNDGLQAFFKGIYVTVTNDSGDDGLLYLNPTDSESKFRIYFDAPNSVDSIYELEITNQAAWVTQYKHNFTGSDVEQLLNTPDDNHDIMYVSAYSGTKGVFEIPDLSILNNAIINKAEIFFYQTDFASPLAVSFPTPSNLILFLNNPNGTVSLLPGVTVAEIEDFGGQRETAQVNGQTTLQYKFNITEYIQQLVNSTIPPQELSLSVLSVNSGDRVKIGGANHPDFPVKLKILYTLAD